MKKPTKQISRIRAARTPAAKPAPRPATRGGAEVPEHLAALIPGTVKCPKCGMAQTAVPVTVLRPDDGALGLLFQGTLNLFTCISCGTRFKVESLILYRDDAKKCLVCYIPEADAGAPQEAEAQVRKIMEGCFGPEVAGEVAPQCRLVFRRQDLVEKIVMLRAELDDRLVEYIKYQLYLKRATELDPRKKALLYDFSNGDKEQLAFVVFDRKSGRAESATHVPMALYRELADACRESDELRGEMTKLFPGMRVNASGCF